MIMTITPFAKLPKYLTKYCFPSKLNSLRYSGRVKPMDTSTTWLHVMEAYFCYRCQTIQISGLWTRGRQRTRWQDSRGYRASHGGLTVLRAKNGAPTGEWLAGTSSGACGPGRGPSSAPAWCSCRSATSPWEHSPPCFSPVEENNKRPFQLEGMGSGVCITSHLPNILNVSKVYIYT